MAGATAHYLWLPSGHLPFSNELIITYVVCDIFLSLDGILLSLNSILLSLDNTLLPNDTLHFLDVKYTLPFAGPSRTRCVHLASKTSNAAPFSLYGCPSTVPFPYKTSSTTRIANLILLES